VVDLKFSCLCWVAHPIPIMVFLPNSTIWMGAGLPPYSYFGPSV
jgi:hypothetical protein